MSIADELEKLKKLLDSEVINEAEYSKLKNNLINNLDEETTTSKINENYHIKVEEFILDDQHPRAFKDKDWSISIAALVEKEFKKFTRYNLGSYYHPYIVNNVDQHSFENFEYPKEYIRHIFSSNKVTLENDEKIHFLVMSPVFDKSAGVIFTNKRFLYRLPLLEGKSLFKQKEYSMGIHNLNNLPHIHYEISNYGQSIPLYCEGAYIGSIVEVGIKTKQHRNAVDSHEKIRKFFDVILESIQE
jgi:vacuolar-type H+-ATPase subunit I/STV1